MFQREVGADPVAVPFPHACGDVPMFQDRGQLRLVFSPRLWGCSEQPRNGNECKPLFPTPVGMFLPISKWCAEVVTFPHACGDVPLDVSGEVLMSCFSPRLWGCSAYQDLIDSEPDLFPTPVGMFRRTDNAEQNRQPFPHACGDVPYQHRRVVASRAFSPRLWGCSVILNADKAPVTLFPTPVGMFRVYTDAFDAVLAFPHACGDVPATSTSRIRTPNFSPRLWGCSGHYLAWLVAWVLFPTPVGMFRTSSRSATSRAPFPHACGDVPVLDRVGRGDGRFSPRLWGCSGRLSSRHGRRALFPTPVGMFRCRGIAPSTPAAFPHACGDVPLPARSSAHHTRFSPRLWGCSVSQAQSRFRVELFPTPVGMFRANGSTRSGSATFPHACGDVPAERLQ